MWNSNDFSIAPVLASYDRIKDTCLETISGLVSWYKNKKMNSGLFP
jgi:hypothetical protein